MPIPFSMKPIFYFQVNSNLSFTDNNRQSQADPYLASTSGSILEKQTEKDLETLLAVTRFVISASAIFKEDFEVEELI